MFPLARPIRHPVHWQAGFSKSQGLPANVSFLPLPLPPLFNFLSLGPFFAWPKHFVSRSLFAPKPQGNACYAGYFQTYGTVLTSIYYVR